MIPTNLLLIVAIQAGVLLCLLFIAKRIGTSANIHWRVSIGAGVAFGVLMDSVLGNEGIFAYLPSGVDSTYSYPNELPLTLLFFNAIASYGIAALSVATIAQSLFEHPKSITNASLWIASFIVGGLFAVLLAPDDSLALMIAWGVAIIGASELLLYIGNRLGPIMLLLNKKNYRPTLNLFVFSLLVGAVYELANLAFPFWVWLPESSVSQGTLRIIITLFGYFVLFYPMAALYILIIDTQQTRFNAKESKWPNK